MSYRYKKRYFSKDPYQTIARFNSTCQGCGETINKGDMIYYWPAERRAYCDCAAKDFQRFKEVKFDEVCLVNRSL